MRVAAIAFLATVILAAETPPVHPCIEWKRIEQPKSIKYSTQRLEALRAWLKAIRATAMMVTVGGQTLFAYGDVNLVSKVASVRKSILAMLFGKYIVEGKVDPNYNVKQLGLADVTPFLPIEQNASLMHLLTARSGIYLDAGNKEHGAFPNAWHASARGEFSVAELGLQRRGRRL